ncbi:MAG TPA: hypothetical protein VFX59_03800 [Polyangiales bacterium]|nr:hypothetical protein [Polyangiales bacterium]
MGAPLLVAPLLDGALAHADASGSQDAAGAETLFAGRFKYAGKSTEDEVRKKSVEKAVSEFFALTRPIARKRLEAKTHIPEWIELKQKADVVVVQTEGRAAEPSSLKGATKGKDPDGNDAEFTARWDGDKLVQTVTTEEGKRTNTFAPQADGSVKLSVELRSEKFETPIRYTLTYRRN